MSISERSESRSFVQIPAFSDNTMLAIIAVGFCLLHVMTAVFLMPPSATSAAATPPEKSLALYD